MDFEGLENAPLSEDDERSMSRQDEAIFKINDKHHKGELRRQSPFSDGETTIKVADGNQLLKSYDSESFEIQDTLSNRNEKSRLIEQVLALQSTLDDLSQRVDAVKDENLKLKSENQILGQYIENLMAASNVFQAPGDTKGHKSAAKSSKKR